MCAWAHQWCDIVPVIPDFFFHCCLLFFSFIFFFALLLSFLRSENGIFLQIYFHCVALIKRNITQMGERVLFKCTQTRFDCIATFVWNSVNSGSEWTMANQQANGGGCSTHSLVNIMKYTLSSSSSIGFTRRFGWHLRLRSVSGQSTKLIWIPNVLQPSNGRPLFHSNSIAVLPRPNSFVGPTEKY